jgi:triphosphatase
MGNLIALRPRTGALPRRLRLSQDMRADDAFRAILNHALAAAAMHGQALHSGRNVMALHDLRVALRRLEVMLGAFGKAFGQDWFGELRGRTKAISSRLSPARDMDVFLEDLWPKIAGKDADLVPLRRAAEAARNTAWKEVTACIASEEFRHLLDDIAALAQSRLPLGDGRGIRPVSRELLARAAKRVKRRGRQAQSGVEADLHSLRIGLKKMRYLSQALAPLHDAGRAKPYLKALKQLQEDLGQLNDIAHLQGTIATLLQRDHRDAIGAGAGYLCRKADRGKDRAIRKALKRYGDFRKLRCFWR